MTGREHANATAADLLRTALLAKLAVDLDDVLAVAYPKPTDDQEESS